MLARKCASTILRSLARSARPLATRSALTKGRKIQTSASQPTAIFTSNFNTPRTSCRNYFVTRRLLDANKQEEGSEQDVNMEDPGAGLFNNDVTVVESSDQGFEEHVLNSPVPVIIEFYTPGSAPCNQMHEKFMQRINKYSPALRLVRIDVSKNAKLAQDLRVPSLPFYFAFYGGRPFNTMTAVPDDKPVDRFFDTALKIGASRIVNEIYTRAEQKLTEKDLSGAAALFGAILNEHRLKCESIGLAGLALVGVAEGKVQEAKEIIDSIKQRYPADIKFPAVSKAISQVELAMQAAGAKSIDTTDLAAKVAANPEDLDARYDLAVAQNAAAQYAEAIDSLIEIVKRDKTWQENKARSMILKMFETLGADNDVTKSGRRKLTNALFR